MGLRTINFLTWTACVVLIFGCAAKEGPRVQRPGEERIVRDNSELLALAKEYEEKKQFKKALNTLKDMQSADPFNMDIRSRIKRLETGLNDAVRKHLNEGKSLFKSGDREASQKEFLMVLFVDPDNREALGFLRELSDTLSPAAGRKPDEVMMETRPKDYKEYTEHTLQSGETLSILAQKYYGDKMKYDVIAAFNDIKDVNKVHVGQLIKVPVLDKTGPSSQPVKAGPEQTVKPPKEAEAVKIKEVPKEEPRQKPEKQKPAMPDIKNIEETFNKAEKYFEEEKYKEAIDNYQKVVNAYPEHAAAVKRLDASKKIISYVQNGNEFVFTRKYSSAYDEFSRVLVLNPRSAVARRELDKLVSPMLAQASYLLRDEQSPCKAIPVIEKILKR
ncbi:MAG: LysM peptidoglycan-binding domain-containing protein, partial [Nitrospirota bacterium]